TAGEEKPVYRRPMVIGATAGVLAAAVAIPVFALAGGGGSSGSSLEAAADNSGGEGDPTSAALRAHTPGLPSPPPRARRAGAGGVWVTEAGGTVAKIDPQTNAVEQTIPVGDGPESLAVSGKSVWVANSLDGTVSRINADANRVVGGPYKVGNTPTGVAVGDG